MRTVVVWLPNDPALTFTHVHVHQMHTGLLTHIHLHQIHTGLLTHTCIKYTQACSHTLASNTHRLALTHILMYVYMHDVFVHLYTHANRGMHMYILCA